MTKDEFRKLLVQMQESARKEAIYGEPEQALYWSKVARQIFDMRMIANMDFDDDFHVIR